MLKLIVAFAAVAALVSSPAMARDKKPKDPSQKTVCREVQLVGSHIPDRVCMTQAEWDQEKADAQVSYRGIVNRINSSTQGQTPGQVNPTGAAPH